MVSVVVGAHDSAAAVQALPPSVLVDFGAELRK